MDNQCNRDLDQKILEIENMQKAASVQLTQQNTIETSFNIGSSVMRALDFSVDIDDEDLFPAGDNLQKN